MLLAENIEGAELVIEQAIIAGRECGLEINKQKSNIIIFNMRDRPQEIAGINVKENVKYLGITINNTKNLFKTHKENMLQKAVRLSNLTYSIVARSCSRLNIGKTYWKSVALPSILYGANVVDFTKQEIEKLQRIENSVCRKILGAPSYSQTSALKGEVGISSMKARIMEGQLKYLQYILRGEGNDLIEKVVGEMRDQRKRNKWINGLLEDRQKVGIRGDKITSQEIRMKVKAWDKTMWKQEMQEKVSLRIYRTWREEIGGQEEVYDNSEKSVILFKCRTNNMDLRDRKRFNNGSTECIMCGDELEDLSHFILHCPAYNEDRGRLPALQRPYQQDEDFVIGKVLFGSSEIENIKTTLHKFWQTRERKIKEITP